MAIGPGRQSLRDGIARALSQIDILKRRSAVEKIRVQPHEVVSRSSAKSHPCTRADVLVSIRASFA